jgi:hypothetical protein
MSFLERMNAEELATLAFSVSLVLARTFNDVELSIIGFLLVSIASVIETMAAIEEVQQALVATVAEPPLALPELEQLIQQLCSLLIDMQNQNEILQQEISDLRDKLS